MLQTRWRANAGPQQFALQLPDNTYEILYGGARGGGKTDAGLAWIGKHQADPRYRALVIRRNADDLTDWIDRVRVMYPHAGIAYRPAIITFPSGAIIRTGHLKDEGAYTKYQGHEYQRILIEELTQIPNEKRYMQLISSCRSTVPGILPQIFATTNPGGLGHDWVKERFVDFSLPFKRKADPVSGRYRIYIPARVDDNPKLMKADPNYVHTLESLKSTDEDLWKAWRMGDWEIWPGQAFREFSKDTHVTNHFDFDLKLCKRFIGFDWGYAAPGSAHWMALTPENKFGIRRLYVYRELYQVGKHPEEWANDLRIINSVDPVSHIVMPHDTYNEEYGDSIAEIFHRVGGLRIKRASTLTRGARHTRKALMHRWLSMADDGKPYMLIHPNCKNLIKTIPTLINDETDPEDIDTDGEDHAYDSTTIVLLMEAPRFGDTGALESNKPYQFRKTFAPSAVGKPNELQGPDFWTELTKKKPGSSRWQKDR